MRAHVTVLALQGHGAEPREYEDAVWIGDGAGRGLLPEAGPACTAGRVERRGALRAALADGAAESLLARGWAELLVRACGAAPTPLLCDDAGFAAVLARAADHWPELTRRYLAERERRGMPVQPYESRKLERGAHASVLAAHFVAHPWPATRGQWAAAALGDTCLFQVRGDRLWRSFGQPAAPGHATSNGRDRTVVPPGIRLAQGTWTGLDHFYLTTGAAGAWFRDTAEHGGRPWHELRDLGAGPPDRLARWAAERRREQALAGGDLTIVRIEPEG